MCPEIMKGARDNEGYVLFTAVIRRVSNYDFKSFSSFMTLFPQYDVAVNELIPNGE